MTKIPTNTKCVEKIAGMISIALLKGEFFFYKKINLKKII